MDKYSEKNNNKIKAYIFGNISGLIVAVIVAVLFSAVAVWLDLGRSYSNVAASLCLSFASAISGYVTVRKIGNRGLFNGTVCGIIVFVICKLIGLFFFNGQITLAILFHIIISVVSGIIGGITAVNRKEKFVTV